MNAGSIEEDNLASGPSLPFRDLHNSEDTIACGLGLGTDNGKLLADECIEQGGLASVGPAQDAHESGMKGHVCFAGQRAAH